MGLQLGCSNSRLEMLELSRNLVSKGLQSLQSPWRQIAENTQSQPPQGQGAGQWHLQYSSWPSSSRSFSDICLTSELCCCQLRLSMVVLQAGNDRFVQR